MIMIIRTIMTIILTMAMTMTIPITIKIKITIKIEIEIEIEIKIKINEHNEHKWNGLRWNLIYNCHCLKFNKLRLGDFNKEVLLLCSEIGCERIFIGGFDVTQVSLIMTQVKIKSLTIQYIESRN